MAGHGYGGHTVTMAHEPVKNSFGEPEADAGPFDDDSQASRLDLENRLGTTETTVQDLQGQLSQARTRMEQAELEIGTLPGMRIELREVVEHVTRILAEVSKLREQVDALCRLVWVLNKDHSKPSMFPDLTTKQPTKEEIEEARRVLKDFLGLDRVYVDQLVSDIEKKNARKGYYRPTP